MAIHQAYASLTTAERVFVDEQLRVIAEYARHAGIALANDDRAERAAEALAAWVVTSRLESGR